MGPYHSPPTCHSMISPSQPWALQAPTPPFPGTTYTNLTTRLKILSPNRRPGSSMSNGTGKPEPTPFRALYNYKPQNDDEVPFCYNSPLSCPPMYHQVELHEGDIVYVMEKCDDGWFVGTSQRTGETTVLKKNISFFFCSGIFGTFPGNYVTQI